MNEKRQEDGRKMVHGAVLDPKQSPKQAVTKAPRDPERRTRPQRTACRSRVVRGCVALVSGLLALGLVGCGVNPLKGPSETFLGLVGDEYLAYVDADPEMGDLDRFIRHEYVKSFERAVKEAD